MNKSFKIKMPRLKMTWKATLNFLGVSSIIFIAFIVVTNPTFENFTSLVILALGCFLFANIGIIKRGKATVDGGLEIETHEPVINPNAVEPPDDEKVKQIEKVEGALEKESTPQPYEPSDDPFYDALRASIVYKDLALTEDALKFFTFKIFWSQSLGVYTGVQEFLELKIILIFQLDKSNITLLPPQPIFSSVSY